MGETRRETVELMERLDAVEQALREAARLVASIEAKLSRRGVLRSA